MKRFSRRADRLLVLLVFFGFARGCCPQDSVSKSLMSSGEYVAFPSSAAMPPFDDLRLFVDEDAETARIEYDDEGQRIIVEYEVTVRRFSDEEG